MTPERALEIVKLAASWGAHGPGTGTAAPRMGVPGASLDIGPVSTRRPGQVQTSYGVAGTRAPADPAARAFNNPGMGRTAPAPGEQSLGVGRMATERPPQLGPIFNTTAGKGVPPASLATVRNRTITPMQAVQGGPGHRQLSGDRRGYAAQPPRAMPSPMPGLARQSITVDTSGAM